MPLPQKNSPDIHIKSLEPVVVSRNREGGQFLETLFEAWSKPCLKPQTTTGLAVLLEKPVSSFYRGAR